MGVQIPTISLNNGYEMPVMGFGTYSVSLFPRNTETWMLLHFLALVSIIVSIMHVYLGHTWRVRSNNKRSHWRWLSTYWRCNVLWQRSWPWHWNSEEDRGKSRQKGGPLYCQQSKLKLKLCVIEKPSCCISPPCWHFPQDFESNQKSEIIK